MILSYMKLLSDKEIRHGSLTSKNIFVKLDFSQILITDFQNSAHVSRPMSSLNETKYQCPLIIT